MAKKKTTTRQSTGRSSRKPAGFEAVLFKYPGKGGWTFAPVPSEFAPPYKMAWGRTPVRATVDGKEWDTSVWTEKSGRILLPVPKKIRGGKGDGDTVQVELQYGGRRR